MKKFVVDFFRNYPVCTGLLSFLIALHLIGAKDLRTPIVAMNKDLFPLFFLYVFIMAFYMLFILPKTEQQKREKQTWLVVVVSIISLTIIAKIIIP